MGITTPYDSVVKITSLKRYQRDWINSHKTINYSGLVQTMIDKIIAQNDPDYLLANPQTYKRSIPRQETTQLFISIL